jgi:iron(III) transport system ATP-binding protein
MSVAIKNLNKTFVTSRGNVVAVCDHNLEVKKGEFFSLLGPSGCGKTTIVRCLAGLEKPDKGDIRLGEELVFSSDRGLNVPAHMRNIGMVFQSYAVWPHMSVYENMAFPLKYGVHKRLSQREIRERVSRACALVSLEGFESRPVTQLSGGQQQRVSLARSLIREPEVVLLDEPLSNLDAKLRVETRIELRQVLKNFGATAIYVTHDQSEAFAVSDRIGVMLNGRIIQIGTPREIYLRPNHTFVADFVGRINFLEGVVIQHGITDNGKSVRTQIGIIHCELLDKVAVGQNVKLGIRGESIKICQEMGDNCFPARVKNAVFLGEYIDCEIDIHGQSFSMKVPPETEVTTGSHVDVLLPYSALILLP